MNKLVQQTQYRYQSSQQKLHASQKKLSSLDGKFRRLFLQNDYFPVLVESCLDELVWQFEIKYPLGTIEQQNKYLNQTLNDLHQFFCQHTDLFVYYRIGDTHRDDEIFFLESPLLNLYAKVVAAEQFNDYLHRRCDITSARFDSEASATNLFWTKSQVAFVELANSLHEAKAFNNGDLSLHLLINSLSNWFQVKLNQDPNRIWQDIKGRKKTLTYF